MTGEERRNVLDRTIQKWVTDGWRVENRSDYQATMIAGKSAGRRMARRGLLGVMFGTPEQRCLVSVDEAGNVSRLTVR